jgi:hypothetical protein
MIVTMNNAVFWNMVPCRPCLNQRFVGMSVQTRSTQQHIQEDDILQCLTCFECRQIHCFLFAKRSLHVK